MEFNSKGKEPTVPVGLELKTNKPVFISEIPKSARGLKCGCVCPNPDCRAPLIARFPTSNKVEHFAHHRSKATPKCSEYGLHLAGEVILLRQKHIVLPSMLFEPDALLKDLFGIDIRVPAFHIFDTNRVIALSDLKREVTIKDD